MLQERVPDGSIKRLVGKCLKVGVLEGEVLSWSESGTTQGSIISPLLGNIYLHYVLDLWFERVVKPRLDGVAHLVRYADDFIITFQNQDDATRVKEVLFKRMEKFDLVLHPDKTRLVPFQRPKRSLRSGKGPGTFDMLGFTFHWRRARSGAWVLGNKTKRKSSNKFLREISSWCRRHRHWPVKEQHRKLREKLHGHLNYFAVSGNSRCASAVVYHTKQIWVKWLRRRSQRARKLTKEIFFSKLLRRFPLPRANIRVRVWA